MENLPERKPLFDTFDWLIGIGAVPFQSAPIFAAAVLLVIARHWTLPARGFFVIARDVFGAQQVTPLWCKALPGLERYLMSNEETQEAPIEAVAAPLPVPPRSAGQPIAKTGNRVNVLLTGNSVAGEVGNDDEIPEDIVEARKILQRSAKIQALADLIKAGKVGQVEGIEIVFGVKPSGRADSLYAQIRAQLLPLVEKPKYRELDEDLQPVVK